MNTDIKEDKIPEEVLQLVPWFVTGKLSIEEKEYFDNALLKYPALQQEVNYERDIAETVLDNKILIEAVSLEPIEERLKSVLNQIDAIAVNDRLQIGLEELSLFDKIKQKIKSLSSGLYELPQYTRSASAAVLVVSVAVLVAFVAPLFTQKSDFTPASVAINGSETVNAQTVLLIGFNGSAAELGSFSILKNKVVKVESVPNKKGMYKVNLNAKLNPVEINKAIERLTSERELVWFAGEAF